MSEIKGPWKAVMRAPTAHDAVGTKDGLTWLFVNPVRVKLYRCEIGRWIEIGEIPYEDYKLFMAANIQPEMPPEKWAKCVVTTITARQRDALIAELKRRNYV